MSLTGKTALVTGGGRGIGRAIALELAARGADIVLNYAGNAKAAAAAKEAVEASGGRCTLAQADLCRPDCARDLAFVTEGKIDILVLNASVQYKAPWEKITEEQFEAQVNCNLRASLFLMQAFVPHMERQGWGRIITVGSVQERKPHQEMAVYAATKAAQTMLSQALSVQLAPKGITVNNLAPGVIRTDRNQEALADEAYRSRVLRGIPAGDFGSPQDCAGLAAFLCSEEARYLTGQNIFVDGGMGCC